jgi:hypothetical protein
MAAPLIWSLAMAEQAISAQDRLDILELLGRYFFALDSGDEAAVLACFTGDAIVRYDSGECYAGPQGLRRFVAKAIGGDDTSGRMHLNFPLFFQRDGEAIVLASYLSAARWRLPDPPQAFGSLRYVEDRCVKVDGAWRIRERAIHLWNDRTVEQLRRKM